MKKVFVISFIFSFIIVLSVGSYFSVHIDNENFSYRHMNTTYKGQAFTGLAYKFYRNYIPYRIQFFKSGQQVLTEYRWHFNGVKWMEIEYKNGQNHGQKRVWYKTGKVMALKNYRDGQSHGEAWDWHSNGVVSMYKVYDQGRLKAYKSFIGDGKPFYNYVHSKNKKVGLRAGQFCKTKKL